MPVTLFVTSFDNNCRRRHERELVQELHVLMLRELPLHAAEFAFALSCSDDFETISEFYILLKKINKLKALFQTLICVSVNRSVLANSVRSGPDKYRCTENLLSSSKTCA